MEIYKPDKSKCIARKARDESVFLVLLDCHLKYIPHQKGFINIKAQYLNTIVV